MSKCAPSEKPIKLSAIAELVAECYAVVYPEAPGRSKAMQWLNRTRKSATGKTGIKSDEMTKAIEELVAASILHPSIDSERGIVSRGPLARLGHITRFCISAHERGTAGPILKELSSGNERYHFRTVDRFSLHLEQTVRLALIADAFEQYADTDLPLHIWIWLTEPLASPYLERLPLQHREAACNMGTAYLAHHLQPISVFANTVEKVAPNVLARTLLARAYVFQGDFRKADKLLTSLETSALDDKRARLECQSLRGVIAMLKGDDQAAMAAIRNALEIERDGSRKRILYPDTPSFSIALFSLVRFDTAESRALLKSLMEARSKLGISSEMDTLLAAADNADKPSPHQHGFYLRGEPTIMSVLFAIASRWHPSYHLPENHEEVRLWLEDIARKAEAGAYSWVLSEIQIVLDAYCPNPEYLATDIKTLFAAQTATARQEALGVLSLTHLVSPIESWDYTLRELEQLALKSKPAGKGAVEKANTGKARRLVWQLSGNSPFSTQATPIEQTLGKDGQWSSGRRVALKRLAEKPDGMDHLTELDIKASRTIQKQVSYRWGESTNYETTQRTLFELRGHPCIFTRDGERVDVIERPPVLHLSELEGRLRLVIDPERRSNQYQSEMDIENRRLSVTRFSAAQTRIDDVIPEKGLLLPKSTHDRLHELLNTLATDISVQGDTDVAEQSLINGNPDPLLAMEPFGASLRVRLRVEPLPGSGMYFDAGTGGSVVYVQGPDGSVSVQRNLEAERSRMQEIVMQSMVLTQYYDGRPHVVLDDALDALELLEEAQDAGIRCLWPENMPFRIKARAGVGNVNLSIKSGVDWFAASGTLSTGEEDIVTLEQLLRLMAEQPGTRFIELGTGEYLSLSRTLKQQLETLQAFSRPARGSTGKSHTHPMALLALDTLVENATVKADKQWKQLRQRISRAIADTPATPPTLQAELRTYQQEGFAWLSQLGRIGAGACLADDMGLGKTVQALGVLLARAEGGPALVVAPTSVVGNWLQEAQRFAPTLNMLAYADTTQQRQGLLRNITAGDVVVISYGLLVNDIDYLDKVQWHSVVLDEAQAIKNAATRRAKCARQLRADFRIATTGTPVQNNLMDLHSLFGFLNPQLLGSESSFRQRFALPITRDNDTRAREQLQSLVSPFLLRRHKRDVLKELPARTELTLDVKLSSEEAALYEVIRREALELLEQGDAKQDASKQKFVILSYLTRLRRLCCNPSLVAPGWTGPNAKLDVFAETLEELIASGHKALVFSQFVDHLKIVEQYLISQSIRYQYIDGSVPAKVRTERVSAFQGGAGDVFLISLTAGGTGLNLTAADYVIHLDPWWNPAVEDQASDRAHRLGQQRPVTIVRMVTTGTIEEQIQILHSSKRELADSVLAGTDHGSFDAETMMRLLKGEGGSSQF